MTIAFRKLTAWLRGISQLWVASLCGIVAATGLIAGSGPAGTSLIAATLTDPLSLFAARSPGLRAAGALTQTKPILFKPRNANERVLGGQRKRHPLVVINGIEPLTTNLQPELLEPLSWVDTTNDGIATPINLANLPSGSIGGGAKGTVPIISGVSSGVVSGSSGGGGSSIPIDQSIPSNSPIVTASAVPEPSTWISLLIGLFTIGSLMRLSSMELFKRSVMKPVRG